MLTHSGIWINWITSNMGFNHTWILLVSCFKKSETVFLYRLYVFGYVYLHEKCGLDSLNCRLDHKSLSKVSSFIRSSIDGVIRIVLVDLWGAKVTKRGRLQGVAFQKCNIIVYLEYKIAIYFTLSYKSLKNHSK